MDAWIRLGLQGMGILTLLFGLFSAASPGRSIALYQALMTWFNWRVSPIDERRELATTRLLGGLMVLLSLAMFKVLGGRVP